MGLDTTHGCWHGAYSAFTRWRHIIAKAAGYWVAPLEYLDGSKSDTVIIDWGHVTEQQLHGEWDATPADPLMVLIAHHDDRGKIHPQQAAALADRLEQLLPEIPDTDEGGHIGRMREKTQTFIDGLRRAAAAGETVEFG